MKNNINIILFSLLALIGCTNNVNSTNNGGATNFPVVISVIPCKNFVLGNIIEKDGNIFFHTEAFTMSYMMNRIDYNDYFEGDYLLDENVEVYDVTGDAEYSTSSVQELKAGTTVEAYFGMGKNKRENPYRIHYGEINSNSCNPILD